MNEQKIIDIIIDELSHIPSKNQDVDQQRLRSSFSAIRKNDLSRSETATRESALVESIQIIKKDNPRFDPEYDREFFKT